MSIIKFRPLGPRVLVKRWPEVEARESGLILPARARELPQIGRVLAVGPGYRNRKTRLFSPLDIEVGDDVVFEKFVAVDHKLYLDGEEFLLIPYDQLYLVQKSGEAFKDVIV
jgi:chaperonin GroES